MMTKIGLGLILGAAIGYGVNLITSQLGVG
jgi:uncharacterized membrane protein (Fun14 family)